MACSAAQSTAAESLTTAKKACDDVDALREDYEQKITGFEDKLKNMAGSKSLKEADFKRLKSEIIEEISKGSVGEEDEMSDDFFFKALAAVDNSRRCYLSACFDQRARGLIRVDFVDPSYIRFDRDDVPSIIDPVSLSNHLGYSFEVISIWKRETTVNGTSSKKVSATILLKNVGSGKKAMADAVQAVLRKRYSAGFKGRLGLNIRPPPTYDFDRLFARWKANEIIKDFGTTTSGSYNIKLAENKNLLVSCPIILTGLEVRAVTSENLMKLAEADGTKFIAYKNKVWELPIHIAKSLQDDRAARFAKLSNSEASGPAIGVYGGSKRNRNFLGHF